MKYLGVNVEVIDGLPGTYTYKFVSEGPDLDKARYTDVISCLRPDVFEFLKKHLSMTGSAETFILHETVAHVPRLHEVFDVELEELPLLIGDDNQWVQLLVESRLAEGK